MVKRVELQVKRYVSASGETDDPTDADVRDGEFAINISDVDTSLWVGVPSALIPGGVAKLGGSASSGRWRGSVDLSAASTLGTPRPGDIIRASTNVATSAVHASWGSFNRPIRVAEKFIWNGTTWSKLGSQEMWRGAADLSANITAVIAGGLTVGDTVTSSAYVASGSVHASWGAVSGPVFAGESFRWTGAVWERAVSADALPKPRGGVDFSAPMALSPPPAFGDIVRASGNVAAGSVHASWGTFVQPIRQTERFFWNGSTWGRFGSQAGWRGVVDLTLNRNTTITDNSLVPGDTVTAAATTAPGSIHSSWGTHAAAIEAGTALLYDGTSWIRLVPATPQIPTWRGGVDFSLSASSNGFTGASAFVAGDTITSTSNVLSAAVHADWSLNHRVGIGESYLYRGSGAGGWVRLGPQARWRGFADFTAIQTAVILSGTINIGDTVTSISFVAPAAIHSTWGTHTRPVLPYETLMYVGTATVGAGAEPDGSGWQRLDQGMNRPDYNLNSGAGVDDVLTFFPARPSTAGSAPAKSRIGHPTNHLFERVATQFVIVGSQQFSRGELAYFPIPSGFVSGMVHITAYKTGSNTLSFDGLFHLVIDGTTSYSLARLASVTSGMSASDKVGALPLGPIVLASGVPTTGTDDTLGFGYDLANARLAAFNNKVGSSSNSRLNIAANFIGTN